MTSAFSGCPAGKSPDIATKLARLMLQKAHVAACDFLMEFELARKRKTAGTSTDAEQDLLRAMLVFASAGLDAMVKSCVQQALPRITSHGAGLARLRDYVARRAKRGDGLDYSFFAEALVSDSPRDRLARAWISELTAGSQQSIEALEQAGHALGVKPTADRNTLRAAFEARNQIVHEMDLKPVGNRSRRQRARGEMVGHTQTIFTAAAAFLAGVEVNLAANNS